MLFDPVPAFLSPEYHVKFATETWELREAALLRSQVFCVEQKIFVGDDRDDVDASAIQIVAISSLGVAADAVVGTVRIHETEPRIWWGSRLAVAAAYRGVGSIGTSLIMLAVGSARARGASAFFAYVQRQNVRLFERLHWTSLGEVGLHGRPHHYMQADLAHYPAIADPWIGLHARLRQAA
jgi:putative N-acetyltransferase (TIGR04045 family)